MILRWKTFGKCEQCMAYADRFHIWKKQKSQLHLNALAARARRYSSNLFEFTSSFLFSDSNLSFESEMYFWHTSSNVGQVVTGMGEVVTATAAALDMTSDPGQVCANWKPNGKDGTLSQHLIWWLSLFPHHIPSHRSGGFVTFPNGQLHLNLCKCLMLLD